MSDIARQQVEEALTEMGETQLVPPARAALLCARHENPDRSQQAAEDLFSALADGARICAAKAQDPAYSLRRLIHEDHGLDGCHDNFDDLDNANVALMAERRCGLPVALGVAYLHAARAAKWSLAGVDFPTRFVLRLDNVRAEDGDRGAVFIDPFERGRPLTISDLENRTKAMAEPLEASMVAPIPDRDVIVRLQNNILVRARYDELWDVAERAALRRALIAPDQAHYWLDLAAARADLGALQGAKAALDRADATPTADTRVREATLRLREGLRRHLN